MVYDGWKKGNEKDSREEREREKNILGVGGHYIIYDDKCNVQCFLLFK